MAKKGRKDEKYKRKLDIIGVNVKKDYVIVRHRDGQIAKYKLIGKGHYQKVGTRPSKKKKKKK